MELLKLLDDYAYLDNEADLTIEIEGLCHDPKKCSNNFAYIAIKGPKQDGHAYIDLAVENGAIAVIVQEDYSGDRSDILFIKVQDTRKALSHISNVFYGNPSSKIKVIGVTGTNGKTSTTYFLKEILEKSGKKAGVIGTLGAFLEDYSVDLNNTTPESLELHMILRDMADLGADYVVMEVSSHGVDLNRIDDISFSGGIFTNLTQDHLDFHITMEDYYKSKKTFLQQRMNYKIVNLDGGYGMRMYKDINDGTSRVIGFGKAGHDASIQNIEHYPDTINFQLTAGDKSITFEPRLVGDFNVYNVSGAVLAALEEGIDIRYIRDAVNSLHGVPGRMEKVNLDADFKVVIDYAHTPDGFSNVLTSLREGCKGRLIIIFGCGGDRDKGKRPIMGSIAGQLSDFCIVTSDNPRWEDPHLIIEDIVPGINQTGVSYEIITDRRAAIKKGLEIVKKDDILLIAGKGHEIWQSIKGIEYPFDEKEIVKEFVNNINARN